MEAKLGLQDRVEEILAGVHPGWLKLIDQSKLKEALHAVDNLGDGARTMPEPGKIFEWLRYFGPDSARGCIVGQDPYPTGATGLCFSKNRADGMPKSLEPIVACLEKQKLMKPLGKTRHGDLRPWTTQGLLMANMAATTRVGTSKTHQSIWKPFMQDFLKKICADAQERKISLFFLLWGSEARNGVEKMARAHGHYVAVWTHPSPLADNNLEPERRFVNCTNFAQANAHLATRALPLFVWDNMPSVMAFSDGGCNDNGKASASAAFAAVIAGGQFGRSEIRGTVEPFTYALVDTKKPSLGFRATEIGCTPTNNRAELLGICWMFLALLRGFAFGRVTAVSDSEISVKTLNEWLPQRRAGKKAKGELKNMDLLEIAEALFAALKEQTLSCDLEHTRSHTQLAAGAGARERIIHGGNARADALATETLEDGAALEITSPLVCVRALVLLRSVL